MPVRSYEVIESAGPAGTAIFEGQQYFAVMLPRTRCREAVEQLRAPAQRGPRIDEARLDALEAQFANGHVRGAKLGDVLGTIVTGPDSIFAAWPREPGTGPVPGGSTQPATNVPEPEIEEFLRGVKSQPSVCAPCDPGNSNQPDCDVPPTSGPRGPRRFFELRTCSPDQCAVLVPAYCPGGDAGTKDFAGCDCADDCCSSRR